MDKVSYKDLNAFVNTKVTAAFNKAKIHLKKQMKEKEVKLNAFGKPSTRSLYLSLTREPLKSGSSSSTDYRPCSRGRA